MIWRAKKLLLRTLEDVSAAKNDSTMENVANKIREADNILVTLSRDPSVDEMAAAIGLTLMLDNMGKHATAIYSGKTPNALEFLEPKKTFESNTNSLQDFIIALNKDKADHLRYKIEDDFVKVYITPYRTTIEESDLQFSHGDINVDLVISLNVEDESDLDAALEKHGRIMHDAGAVNISNDMPGKLGGIEWDDPRASSVSEMIVNLIEKLDQEMTENVATALMTGVVAATHRFSNDKTTPETMEISAKLMEAGANQQLIAINIEKTGTNPDSGEEKSESSDSLLDGTILDIARDKKGTNESEKTEAAADANSDLSPEQQLEQMISGGSTSGQNLMDELKNAEPEAPAVEAPTMPEATTTPAITAPTMPEATAPAVTKSAIPEVAAAPEVEPTALPGITNPSSVASEPAHHETTPPVMINAPATLTEAEVPKVATPPVDNEPLFGAQEISSENSTIDRQVVVPTPTGEEEAAVSSSEMPGSGVYETDDDRTHLEGGTVEPLADEASVDYGAMMDKELAKSDANTFGTNPAIVAAPNVAVTPEVQPVEVPNMATAPETQPAVEPIVNPMAGAGNIDLPQAPTPQVPGMEATMSTPESATLPQATTPESAVLPQVQPVAMQGDESAAIGIPAAPEGVSMEAPKEEINPVIVQPEPVQSSANEPSVNAAQEPVRDPASVPPVADPGAFKIPGM